MGVRLGFYVLASMALEVLGLVGGVASLRVGRPRVDGVSRAFNGTRTQMDPSDTPVPPGARLLGLRSNRELAVVRH